MENSLGPLRRALDYQKSYWPLQGVQPGVTQWGEVSIDWCLCVSWIHGVDCDVCG